MKNITLLALVLLSFSSFSQEKIEATWVDPAYVFGQPHNISSTELESIEEDNNFIENLPSSYDSISSSDMRNLAQKIDEQIQKLIREREVLMKSNGSVEIIEAKNNSIKSLNKERDIVKLSIETRDLKTETRDLKTETDELRSETATLKKYLIGAGAFVLVLGLFIVAILQRKTIKLQDGEIESQMKDIGKKNTYLEHAAKLIRHDMHSGINTYIPRGVVSLEKRLTDDAIKELKIDSAIKMIKEGLNHTQRVYRSVYEFTNLVKKQVVLDKTLVDLKDLLDNYFNNTSYRAQVLIDELVRIEVNGTLFCNAIENLVKNGLKYNDSKQKEVRIYMEDGDIAIQDNGRGLTQKEFDRICNAYSKKNSEDLGETSPGLGLNICVAILSEHGFDITCEKNDIGTKLKIKLTKTND